MVRRASTSKIMSFPSLYLKYLEIELY